MVFGKAMRKRHATASMTAIEAAHTVLQLYDNENAGA